MTTSQMTTVQWILLGAMPGAVLLFGGLVWLRRRK
jgi:LPXTG-motif cell wall-anchored protein